MPHSRLGSSTFKQLLAQLAYLEDIIIYTKIQLQRMRYFNSYISTVSLLKKESANISVAASKCMALVAKRSDVGFD